MIDVDKLTQRFLRIQPPTLTYHLERVPVASVEDGLSWMRDWHTPEGFCLWLNVAPTRRREIVQRWMWLRWLFRADITKRGGGA